MNFDQILGNWRAQTSEALWQALHAEEARVQRQLITRRRGLSLSCVVGAGMAIWAAFWIAITLTNRWPAIYAMASGLSLALFTFAAVALWIGRGRKPQRSLGNTLEESVRRSLALVEQQFTDCRHWIFPVLGMASLMVGTGLFSWTVARSQDIPDSSGLGWFWYSVLFAVLAVWVSRKARAETLRLTPELKLRHQRLRELHMELAKQA